MFGGPKFKALTHDQIPAALEIIRAHDEDDYEWAVESYQESIFNQYGLLAKGRLIGVTGFHWDKDVAWISWTYLDPAFQGKGHGETMLQKLLQIMRKEGVRKCFVATSDYTEAGETDGHYARAMRLYESCGFQKELTHPNYYAAGESEMVYGQRLKPMDAAAIGKASTPADLPGLDICNIFLIDETDSAYALDWEESASDASQLSAARLNQCAAHAFDKGASAAFISFPSNYLQSLGSALREAGFFEEGRLRDFHADGIDEIRFRKNPNR